MQASSSASEVLGDLHHDQNLLLILLLFSSICSQFLIGALLLALSSIGPFQSSL